MKSDLLDLWNNIETKTFYIEKHGFKLTKIDIDSSIDIPKKKLFNLHNNWENSYVYFDVKDRLLFIIIFITLLKLKSKIVLVPIEVKPEDYVYKGGIFISDNKIQDEIITVNEDLTLKTDNISTVKKTDNAFDCDMFLYTSGSTGKAKLIPKNLENLIVELNELKSKFKTNSNDKFYFIPPLYHIYGLLFGFLLPVYSNAGIIIDHNFTPESVAKIINEKNVTVFISIPSYYKMFSDLGLISNFKSCRILTNSSAPLPLDISREFYKNNIQITEVYGSTETGGIATRVSAVTENWSIFSYVRIQTDYTRKVQDEIENKYYYELLIDSPGISVDYDKNEGFNTGDIVELHEKDKFKLVGRNTRFVKISGKRVDLKYVFEKLREYLSSFINAPINEQNLYIGEKDEKLFVIFEEKFPKDSIHIKEDLKKYLPGYAIPRYFINIQIPRSEMGKINKIKIEEIINNIVRN